MCSDDQLAAQSTQIKAMEQEMQEAQAGLACALQALGISKKDVMNGPGAVTTATPSANEDMCKVP